MRFSNLSHSVGSLLLLSALMLISPAAGGVPDTTPAELGVVRNDTLVLDRQKVIDAALIHNEMLSASSAMNDAADGDALGAWRGFLPRASVGAYRIRSNDPLNSLAFSLNQRTFNPAVMGSPAVNAPGNVESNITQLKLMQPIFNGGMALYGKRAANAMARSAASSHLHAEATIRFNVTQAFEGLILARTYVNVMETALKSADGHVRQAQSMFDNEMVTEADLLQARVYRDALRQRLIEVRNMVAIAGENIKLLTALDTDLPLIAETDAANLPDPRAMSMLNGSARNRPDIIAALEQAEAASHMKSVARGSLLPHLNMSAEKNYYSADTLLGDDADSWTVGIYATWDIFSGFENIGAVKKANAQSRAASYMSDFKLRQASVQARQSALDLKAAAEKLLVARQTVDAAREGLRIVSNMYREGLVSMVDLLDTQAAATMAEGNLVQAEHDFKIGIAELEFNGGEVRIAGQNPTPAE
jgi:outer membrane protein TolC